MPSNQGEEHSFAFYPFSTVTIVDATKTLWSSSFHGLPSPIHSLLSSAHSSRSHLTRCNFFMVQNTKSSKGRRTLSQLTLHNRRKTQVQWFSLLPPLVDGYIEVMW
jgi:hypothetical protein